MVVVVVVFVFVFVVVVVVVVVGVVVVIVVIVVIVAVVLFVATVGGVVAATAPILAFQRETDILFKLAVLGWRTKFPAGSKDT